MAARGVLPLILALLAGCSRSSTTTPAPPPAPSGSTAAPASSIPAAAVSASAHSDTPPPIPAAPPGLDPERLLFTASLCAAAVMTMPDGKLDVGCTSHPPFDRPEQKPDGKLTRYGGDPLRFCSIDAVYKGAFTRAGAKQAVLSFAQCKKNPPDDDEWDMAFPGSALLVEEAGGRWTADGYEPDVNARSCVSLRRADGRDVLACHSGLRAGPAGGVTYLFQLDFARTGRKAGTFASIFDDMFLCSFLPAAGAPGSTELRLPHGLASVRVADVRAADVNADGAEDLVVQIDRARVAPSKALDAKAAAACARTPGATEATLLPPPARTRLEFVSGSGAIAPTAATRRVLDAWLAEHGDEGGVGAAAPPALGE